MAEFIDKKPNVGRPRPTGCWTFPDVTLIFGLDRFPGGTCQGIRGARNAVIFTIFPNTFFFMEVVCVHGCNHLSDVDAYPMQQTLEAGWR